MGLFGNRQSIQKFNSSYLQLKVTAFKLLGENRALVEKQVGHIADDQFKPFVVMCVEYLLGEDIERPNHLGVKPDDSALRMVDNHAQDLMQIKQLRAFVVALLEYKDRQLSELLGAKWTSSNEAASVRALQQQFGSTDDEELYTEYVQYKNMMLSL